MSASHFNRDTIIESQIMHPLIKSCIFHYEFEFIHPFSDGNGRTGRLWHSLILQKWKTFFAWLPIETLIFEQQEGYYYALNAANTAGESTVFVEFMLNIIKAALIEFKTEENVGVNVGVNVGTNEEKILLLLRHDPKLTADRLAEQLALTKRQTERLLARLKAEGKIQCVGATKNGSWHVSDAEPK